MLNDFYYSTRQRRTDEALKNIDVAIAGQDNIPEYWHYQSEILLKLRRYDEAERERENYINLIPAAGRY